MEIPTINDHLKKVFEDSELDEAAVIGSFRRTASDGKTYETKRNDLAAIIAVGYKVNSKRAVPFRKWATQILDVFIITVRQGGWHLNSPTDCWRISSGGTLPVMGH